MLARFSMMAKYMALWIAMAVVVLIAGAIFARKLYTFIVFQKAQTIAEQILIFRNWAGEYGGFWTKDRYKASPGFLARIEAPTARLYASDDTFLKELRNPTEFYWHNSDLAIRELSDLSKKQPAWTFRIVSDRYLNPEGKPDVFEKKALQLLKSKNLEEFGSWEKISPLGISEYRYVKAIRIKESCLRCHGKPENLDPQLKQALIAKYGPTAVARATNYRVGELAGLISVTVYARFSDLVSNLFLKVENLAYLVPILILFLFLISTPIATYFMIRRIRHLRDAARNISVGKLDIDLGVKGLDEERVRDELLQVAIALERLRISTKILIERFKRK